MNLVTIFLLGFLLLGLLVGPLALAGLVAGLSPDRGRALADRVVGLGLQSVWRPALTFNAANELTLKRRAYDEAHDEQKIPFGGVFSSVERFLFDPQNRVHDFFGTPFAFVDERFGIILDPRDSAVGRSLVEAQRTGTYTRRVEHGERIVESVQGVFDYPTPNVGVRLPDVWPLVGGSFDAQLVRKIQEFYRKSQAPKTSTTALRQLLVPVGTFIAIVLLGMFAAGQGGGGAAAPATSNSTTVSIGESLLFLFAIPAFNGWERRDKAVAAGFGLGAVLLAALLYFVFPMTASVLGIPLPLGVWCIIALGFGAVVLPAVAWFFGRSLGGLGVLLGQLFITIGLLGYDRPVLRLVEDDRYDLVEYDDVEWPLKPEFYRAFMTRLGVGLSNDVDVWGEEVLLSPKKVETMAHPPETGVALADGGIGAPEGYVTTDLLKQENIYGYVPKKVETDSTYVRTDLTTGVFVEAGQNRRLMKAALETAKEKYGGGNKPVADKWILAASLAAMLLGAVFDWLVFFS